MFLGREMAQMIAPDPEFKHQYRQKKKKMLLVRKVKR
jgi:hypothetical protein